MLVKLIGIARRPATPAFEVNLYLGKHRQYLFLDNELFGRILRGVYLWHLNHKECLRWLFCE